MILLAFETATPTGGAALLADGKLLGERVVTGTRAHSRQCLAFARELLDEAGLDWNRLDIIAASHGPGSFTGVRVGLTLAKGLGWSLQKKCISVSTLEAMALNADSGEDAGFVVPLIDARMNEVYGALYRRSEEGLVPEGKEFAAPPAEVGKKLTGPALFCGEGARRYFDEHLKSHGVLAHPARLQASPAAVAKLAYRHAEQGKTADPAALKAVYLREPVPRRD